MRHSFSILFLLICSLNMFGEEHRLYGNVTDKATGGQLPNASVSCEELSKGAFTNDKGYYEIMLPDGDHLIKVESIGYKTVTKKIGRAHV